MTEPNVNKATGAASYATIPPGGRQACASGRKWSCLTQGGHPMGRIFEIP
jgi:hypothetical protein